MQLDHIHCCEDDHLALCGVSLRGVATANPDDIENLCATCDEILDTEGCPHLGTCPHSTGNQQGETENA